jgi:vacuolar-type H+-ATPase subunit I/STV1
MNLSLRDLILLIYCILFLKDSDKVKDLKKSIAEIQVTAEAEGERLANILLKRIQDLKNEKQDLLVKLEAEEEMITNSLQKKLIQLQREKCQMGLTLEREQEFLVNRLQKQVDDLNYNGQNPRKQSVDKSMSNQRISEVLPVVEMMKAEVLFSLNRTIF